jgi:hypothetical protein
LTARVDPQAPHLNTAVSAKPALGAGSFFLPDATKAEGMLRSRGDERGKDMRPIITLTTDFGYADPWVGVMKGVMLSINAELVIVDLTHGVPPQDIMAGALALADAVPFFPQEAIHVAVVDPGVGSERRPIVVRAGSCTLVGPDNGILWPAIERLGGCTTAWHITNPAFLLTPVSSTFHGRDVFAPVAARLSLGAGTAASLGPEITDVQRLSLPTPVVSGERLVGEVIHVDAFGNLITNITAELLDGRDRQKLTVTLNGAVIGGIFRAYSVVPAGKALSLTGSSGRLEIACYAGNAAEHFGASRGTPVEVIG